MNSRVDLCYFITVKFHLQVLILLRFFLKKMFTSSYLFVKVIISILFVGRETGSCELFDEIVFDETI